jgi:hypothetical protein
MARIRSLKVEQIREKCRALVDYLRQAGTSAEALAVMEPGGPENPDSGPDGYLRWYGLLSQAFARDQSRLDYHKETDGKAEADAAAVAALAARPEIVTLVSPGERRTLEVHPKGLEALSAIRARDELLHGLTKLRGRIAKSAEASDVLLVEKVDRELADQLRLLVWAVTHEGPKLPYGISDSPDPPEWTGALDPWDILQVVNAHQRVNGKRLQALARLTAPGEGKDSAPSWSVFAGSVAMELGIQPSVLLRDWSLAEVLTTTRLAAESKRKAHEQAKHKSKASA